MSDIPTSVRDAVIEECYRRAAELDWEALGNRERSRAYDAWLDDPAVGHQLTAFLSRERARVWLKDVPMKEYSRAQAGVGHYARFVATRAPDVDTLAKQALGAHWRADLDSIRVKPNRVRVTGPTGTRLMIWGQPHTLRDLIWAGIVVEVDDDHHHAPVVVLACSRARQPTAADRERHVALARQAGLELVHTTTTPRRAPVDRTPPDSSTEDTGDD